MGFNAKGRMVQLAGAKAQAIKTVTEFVEKNKEALQGMAKSRMGEQILIGTIELVRKDLKKGKVKDKEDYIKKSLAAIEKNKVSYNMVINNKLTLQDIEQTIRGVLDEAMP